MAKEKKIKEKQRLKEIQDQHEGPFLTEDIVMEILSRLSAKSVIRYMCVSKNWKSMISHKYFKILHNQRSHNLLILHDSQKDLINREPVLTTVNLHSGEVVQRWSLNISSLNLRMLPFPYQSKLVCFVDTKRFLLCNPDTKKLMYLPDPAGIVSDPLLVSEDHAYGFGYVPAKDVGYVGYVPAKDVYIIVLFLNPNSPLVDTRWGCVVLAFYTFDDDTKVDYTKERYTKVHHTGLGSLEATLPRIPIMHLRPEGVFVCGNFYWMMCDKDYSTSLLSFRMENEDFSTVELPMQVLMHLEHDPSGYESIVEIKDELYFMSVLNRVGTLQTWKLSDARNQVWTLTSNTCLQSFFYRYMLPLQNEKFEGDVLIYGREYLTYDNDPNNILREMRKLSIRDVGIYAPTSRGL